MNFCHLYLQLNVSWKNISTKFQTHRRSKDSSLAFIFVETKKETQIIEEISFQKLKGKIVRTRAAINHDSFPPPRLHRFEVTWLIPVESRIRETVGTNARDKTARRVAQRASDLTEQWKIRGACRRSAPPSDGWRCNRAPCGANFRLSSPTTFLDQKTKQYKGGRGKNCDNLHVFEI